MKRNLKLFFLLLLLCAGCLTAYSQLPQAPKTALSPNAASLGLYGDVPVSYYTGVPSINIPLYDLAVSDFQLPVSLSYHASGVRPDQHPGWTGLNWSLNAGGVITRNVNDMPDESNNPNYLLGANSGFYYTYNLLNTSSWNQRSYLRQIAQNPEISGDKDTEPDEFSFSFPGYTGKFYRTHTGGWAVQCNHPVKVIFNNTFLEVPFDRTGTRTEIYGTSPSFGGFTIITEDGTQYIFGGTTLAIDYSMSFFLQYIDDWTATAWYLTRIILPNQQDINFTYERGDYINQMYIAVHHDLGSETISSGGLLSPECSSWSFSSIESSYSGKLIAPVYLREIKASNVTITLDRSLSTELNYESNIYRDRYHNWSKDGNGGYSFLPILKSEDLGYPECLNNLKWYKLDKMTVKNATDSIVKTVSFSYNNSSTQRLMLTGITELGKNPYTFEYDNPQSLPPYLANKTDHWGFYNGTYAYLNYSNYSNYYTYRNPNASYLKYGTINKITYPTGGYTEFEFEPHYYRKQLSVKRWESCNELTKNNLAGGLRIKKIKNYSLNNPSPTVKEYFYVSDYLQNKTSAVKSSGVLGGQVQYYFTDYIVYAFNDNNIRRKIKVFSSFSVLPSCNNSNGSHIGYTEVIEKREDNAFTRNVFTNFDNGYMDESADAIIQETRTAYEPYASKEQERGLLILKEEYNAGGVKVRSKTITYEKDDAGSTNYVRCMNARYKNVCPNTAVSYDEGTSYKVYTYTPRLKSETGTYFDPSSGTVSLVDKIDYTYTGQKLVQSVSKTNSDGAIYKTSFKYPSDYGTTVPYSDMVLKNILSPVVEKSEYKNTTTFLSKEVNNYAKWHSLFYAPANQQVQTGSNPIETRMTYSYDSKGNVREIIKDGVDKVTYLWGYNYQYPIAEIKGATYAEVLGKIAQSTLDAIAGKIEPTPSDLSTINALRTTLPGTLVTTYTYRPLVGMISSTDPRGLTRTYEYDTFGRLICIKDHNQNILETYNYHYKTQ